MTEKEWDDFHNAIGFAMAIFVLGAVLFWVIAAGGCR